MRLNKYMAMFGALAVILFAGCKNEDPSEHHFDNKLYVSSSLLTDNLLIEPGVDTEIRTINVRMAQPAERTVTVTVEGRPDLAAQYNMVYGDNAFALPAENWSIPEATRIIEEGTLQADGIDVIFTGIGDLDISDRYVLPVHITSVEGAPLLESHRTVYFVVRGAAIINVAGDVTKMKARFNWSSASLEVVRSMPTITVEALIHCTADSWEAGRDNSLGTVFGIEGHYLLRIGDAGFPRDQLQIVTPHGNWPNGNEAPSLPVGEWVHVAVVYDTPNNLRLYYINGEKVAERTTNISTAVNLNSSNGCYVGYAYDNSRWLPGMMSELRVWNVVRTQEQIAASPYKVDPNSEGLVGYWKFNEGAGNTIHDNTAYGTDITFVACDGQDGPSDIKWVDVQIPSIN